MTLIKFNERGQRNAVITDSIFLLPNIRTFSVPPLDQLLAKYSHALTLVSPEINIAVCPCPLWREGIYLVRTGPLRQPREDINVAPVSKRGDKIIDKVCPLDMSLVCTSGEDTRLVSTPIARA